MHNRFDDGHSYTVEREVDVPPDDAFQRAVVEPLQSLAKTFSHGVLARVETEKLFGALNAFFLLGSPLDKQLVRVIVRTAGDGYVIHSTGGGVANLQTAVGRDDIGTALESAIKAATKRYSGRMLAP